jgi:hypothetical protein
MICLGFLLLFLTRDDVLCFFVDINDPGKEIEVIRDLQSEFTGGS